MQPFSLPDLGEGLASATIQKWYVKEGDTIALDQPLLSVETAKAVVDIPSPQDGTIAERLAEEGDEVATGSALLHFTQTTTPATVVGTLSTHALEDHDKGPCKTKKAPIKHPHAMPAVRALASALGFDLKTIKGSGPDGLIRPEDLANKMHTLKADPTLKGNRGHMAYLMTNAHQQVVLATLHDTLLLETLPKALTLAMIKACIQACHQNPALNAHYQPFEGFFPKKEVHLAIAVDSKHGLFTPVIKQAEALDDQALQAHLLDFKAKAEHNAYPPEMLSDATFTLSNIGAIGGSFGTPIVLPPSVGILSVGQLQKTVQLDANGNAYQAYTLPLSLSFDHRVVRGSEAAIFLNDFKSSLLNTLT